ncbi:hypothetical protein BS78_07G086500 [Paspalum vaginatum]|nr:hypothetical protein BS78_07G086500 [Paspalum vaginatum]
MAANPALSFGLRSILDKEKLFGTNFTNCYRNLRSVLNQEKKEYVLDQPYPEDLEASATAAEHRDYEKHRNDSLDVGCLMLATMFPKLQKQYEDSDAYNMIEGLHGMFENHARVEKYNTSKDLFGSKLAEGSLVSPHVIKMIGHIEALDRLGIELELELATADVSKKRKRKGKGKGKTEDWIQKPKPDAKPKASSSPSDKFSTVVIVGIGQGTARSTWKRRRREVRLPLQGLKQTRSFARGELDVRIGNGVKVALLAVGIYHLSLPSGLVMELNNSYYIPA